MRRPKSPLAPWPARIMFVLSVFVLFANAIILVGGNPVGALGVIVGGFGMWLTWPALRTR